MLNVAVAGRTALAGVIAVVVSTPSRSAAENQWSVSHLAGVALTDDGSVLTHSEPFTGRIGNAAIGSLRLRYGVGGVVSVEGSALYGWTKTKRDSDNPDRLGVDLFSPRIDILLHPVRWQRLVPYALAGVGALSIDRQPRANEFRSAATQTVAAGNLGLGAEYRLSSVFALRADGRTIAYDGGVGLSMNVELSAGISVTWGGDSHQQARRGRDVWQ